MPRLRRKSENPFARHAALAIAAGRVAIGIGTIFATEPALRVLGFRAPGTAGLALARLAGARDLAFGLATIAAREDPDRLRALAGAGAALDAGDAIAFAAAARHPETADAGARGLASGAIAALAGAWAARRLG